MMVVYNVDFDLYVDVFVGNENNDFYCACKNGTLFPQKHGKQGKGGGTGISIITRCTKKAIG